MVSKLDLLATLSKCLLLTIRSKAGFALIAPAVCAVVVYTGSSVNAKTWNVERDGSGDYTVIQDAVDASAAGDTIRIGPGRYDEKQFVTTPGWSDSVRVRVESEELTFIGEGPETIVGPSLPWSDDQGNNRGFAVFDNDTESTLRIESIHFENMGIAIYTSYENNCGDNIVISDCTFRGNFAACALINYFGTASVVDCDFRYMADNYIFLVVYGSGEATVANCEFTLWGHVQIPQTALALAYVSVGNVVACRFYEGATGIEVTSGGQTHIQDSTFDGQFNTALFPGTSSHLMVDGCVFRHQNKIYRSYATDNSVSMAGSVVEDVSYAVIEMTRIGSLLVSDCDLTAGTHGVVFVNDSASCDEVSLLNMSDNYWGTTNPDTIQAWIWDNNDSPNACYIVDYEPFETESTPVEQKSLSDLKGLFR